MNLNLGAGMADEAERALDHLAANLPGAGSGSWNEYLAVVCAIKQLGGTPDDLRDWVARSRRPEEEFDTGRYNGLPTGSRQPFSVLIGVGKRYGYEPKNRLPNRVGAYRDECRQCGRPMMAIYLVAGECSRCRKPVSTVEDPRKMYEAVIDRQLDEAAQLLVEGKLDDCREALTEIRPINGDQVNRRARGLAAVKDAIASREPERIANREPNDAWAQANSAAVKARMARR